MFSKWREKQHFVTWKWRVNVFFLKIIIKLFSEVGKIRNLGSVAIKRFVVSWCGPRMSSVVSIGGDGVDKKTHQENKVCGIRINICKINYLKID